MDSKKKKKLEDLHLPKKIHEKKQKKIKTGGVDIEVNIFVNVYGCERV